MGERPAVADAEGEIAYATEVLLRPLTAYLALPAEWQLPPELRAAGQAVADAALPRLRAALRARAELLHAQSNKGAQQSRRNREIALMWALDNWLLNEVGLNHLDSEGAAHDAWRAQVAATAGWCRQAWGFARWGEVLFEIARLPEAERAAALQQEARVLERWGQARPAVPPRPPFSLDDHAAALLERVRDGSAERRPPVAMVPVVAATLLKDDAPPLAGSDDREPPDRNVRCAALQWALANARQERAAAPEVLALAFRYARMQRIEDTARERNADSAAAQQLLGKGYPLYVARREVTGPVRVRIVRNAKGQVTDAQVVSRRLEAPGLAGQRAVAFETSLDQASLAKARTLQGTGPGTATVEFVWKLED